MTNWYDKVKEKTTELQPLLTRMEWDRNQAYATAFSISDFKGRSIKDIINVTLPIAKNYLSTFANSLMAQNSQVVVEGKIKDDKGSEIENFLTDHMVSANQLLRSKGENEIEPTQSFNVSLRGPIANQVVTRIENGEYIPDVRPLDVYNFRWDYGQKGLLWGANICMRTKADIEDEYGKTLQGTTGIVTDLWTPDENIVYIDDVEAKRNSNEYGYVPFCMGFPMTGSFIKDIKYIQYQWESIFALCRNDQGQSLFDEINFLATILKNKNYDLLDPAKYTVSPDGKILEIPPEMSTPGSNTAMDMGSEVKLMPNRDVAGYTSYYKRMIDELVQIATFSINDYGAMGIYPMSAVAMAHLSSKREKAYLPRLNALASLRESTDLMVLKQNKSNGPVELGEGSNKRTYKTSSFDGSYTIKYLYYSDSKEDAAANATIANALRPFFSDDTIRRTYLKVKSPDIEEAKLDRQNLEMTDPILKLKRQMHALIDASEVDPSCNLDWILELDNILNMISRRELNKGIPLANEPSGKQPYANTNALVPMFGGGGQQTPPDMSKGAV
jgi:roadblock/LC7 domain-containing protein